MKLATCSIPLAIACLAPAAALADDKPDGLWHGNVSVGANFASGNSSSTNVGANADASRARAQDKWAFYFNAAYGESKSDGVTSKTADTIRGGGRYEWNFTPRAFAFGSADLERDGLVDLDLRAVLGGGAGYYLVKEKATTFQLSGGVAYTHESYSDSTGDRNYAALILAEESTHAFTENTSFKQRLALYPDLDETGEYRATFDATLANKLGGNWTLNLTLNWRYNSLPPMGAKKDDTLFLVGVGAKF